MDPSPQITARMHAYKSWRDELMATVLEYHDWLQKQGLTQGTDELRLYELIEAIKADKLMLALVAEFSRGKTELINAIFFAHTGQRLLPSEAGRTTMCPTELLYQPDWQPCVRLLPIETRRSALSVNEYRRMNPHWTTLPLNPEDPGQMADTLKELTRVKTVPVDEARALGLLRMAEGAPMPSGGGVQVPVWRHATINYPHPLLKDGLVILDTPGLNALGTEPELTINTLPNAHAILFILAADTGVTKSDMEVWERHVRPAKGTRGDGCIAVLNKIDTLWDELRGEVAVAASISRQAQEVAQVLGLPRHQIVPVSAQKGLLAKVKDDAELLAKSGLVALETKLANEIIPAKQRLMRERVLRDLGQMIEATEQTIQARLLGVEHEIAELKTLGGKNLGAIREMGNQARAEKEAYDRAVQSFEGIRAVIVEQIRTLLDQLSIASFDRLIEHTRKDLKGSWTTVGLKQAMGAFFDGAAEIMERVNKQSHQIKTVVDTVYQKFHDEHGFQRIRPPGFSLLPHRSALQKLHDEGEAFRNSAALLVTEEHFVINRFIISFVSRARELFTDCNKAAETWARAIMMPLVTQVREHRTRLEDRIEHLKQIQADFNTLGQRIRAQEQQRDEIQAQQHATRAMLERINRPLAQERAA